MDVYRIIRELQNERTKLDQIIASIDDLQCSSVEARGGLSDLAKAVDQWTPKAVNE